MKKIGYMNFFSNLKLFIKNHTIIDKHHSELFHKSNGLTSFFDFKQQLHPSNRGFLYFTVYFVCIVFFHGYPVAKVSGSKNARIFASSSVWWY